MKRFAFSIVVASLMAVPAWAHCGKCGVGDEKSGDKEHTHAELGAAAPDFALKDLEGKEHKLSDLKGKVVVLEWINHECPVVQRYHNSKTMSETARKFEGKDVVWLAIDSSHFCETKQESIREWSSKVSIDYPILLDASGEIGRTYGAKTTPHMYVIDKEGKLAYTGAPDDNKTGNSRDPKNYVEDAVNALLNGSTVEVAQTKPFGCNVKYKS